MFKIWSTNVSENKGLECTIAYNNIECFYINFDINI